MFAKNSKAYSVYLLFRFVCSLAVSMSTVLSIVYHLEVVQLDAFQLVLVGTVQETSCFLFEMPTGVVADLYSRRRSVVLCQEKVQIKYAFFRLAYPAKASAFSSNAA